MCQGVIEACRLIAWALGVLGLNGETSQTLISLVGVGGLGADLKQTKLGEISSRIFSRTGDGNLALLPLASGVRARLRGAIRAGRRGPEKRRLYRRLIASSSGIRAPAAPAVAAAESRGLSKDTAAAERAATPERLTANLYPPRTN